MLRHPWKLGVFPFLEGEEYSQELETGNAHLPEWRYDWTDPKPRTYPTRDCHPVQSLDLILALDEELDKLTAGAPLGAAKNRVGLVYDVVMLGHRNLRDP
jgi:hypothetical protein